MKAEACSLTFLGNAGSVKIPFFQRAYVWNEMNWEELISDLLESNKSHFLGSLILKQIGAESVHTKQTLVIDGQQRLTTLSILLNTLFNSFNDELQQRCKQDGKFDGCLFYKKNVFDDDLLVKIEHSKIDSENYQKVIKNEINSDTIDLKTCKSNVLKCFKFFTDRLKEISLDDRKKLFQDLLDLNNKILVVIDLTNVDDEQAIFDTINSAGVRLSSADIVKNALFQKAFELYSDQKEVEDLYKDYWEDVFDSEESLRIFWNTPRAVGRFYRDNIEILLHSISVIQGFFDPEKHSLPDLSKIYKSYIDRLDKNSFINFIKIISEYAKLYQEKILVFDSSDLFDYVDYHKRLFHILNTCDVSTFHPYILYLYRKFANDEAELKKALKKMEIFVINRAICNSETKSYNRLCKDFINDSSKLDTLLIETKSSDIERALMQINNKHAALLLFWVELYRRKNDKHYDKDALKYAYTLEHIMPQKWEEYWRNVPVVDNDGNIINDLEKAKQYRYKLIYYIGNMTLLKSSLNSALHNYEFQRKIEGEGRKRGIKHYAELGITKLDIVEPYNSGSKIWNEMKIMERTRQITEDVLKIWNISKDPENLKMVEPTEIELDQKNVKTRRTRRKNLEMKKIGIPDKATLCFTEDESITCIANIENNNVSYMNNPPCSLSALAKKLLKEKCGRETTVNGNKYFKYNGEKLWDIGELRENNK